MTLGCTGYNNKCSTYVAYGMGYGLLAHDMVERFLAHYFGVSAHVYTRGTWTTPEAAHPDRDVGSTDYVAAGVHLAPTYLKWALLFEDPNSRAVWVGKAVPRDWLALGQQPLAVSNATTRYGRVSFRIQAEKAATQGGFRVRASVLLPPSYAAAANAPPGGVRLRLRVPGEHAGHLSAVTVGGVGWAHFDAAAETVDFSRAALTPATLEAMRDIVADFAPKSTRDSSSSKTKS